MSNLNKKKVSVVPVREMGLSGNGNVQFVKTDLQKVLEAVVTAIYGVDTLYQSADGKITTLKSAMRGVIKANGQVGMDVLARMALWARYKVGLRTMPMVMGVSLFEIAREFKLKFDHDRRFVSLLIKRADELTDFYAYALTVFGTKNKVPQAIKKGVGDAFNKFDAYQLAKYNRDGALTMKSLMRIVHAVPVDELKSQLFAQLMTDTLPVPNTWETRLSANGQLPVAERLSKADLWTELVITKGAGELGYLALVRNLRNIVQSFPVEKDGVTVYSEIVRRLTDPRAIEKAKVLPWTFFNAYDVALENGFPTVLIQALKSAANISISNVPSLGQRVWLIGDVSGSMNSGGTPGNPPVKLLSILAASLIKSSKGKVELTLFSDRANMATGINPANDLMDQVAIIKKQVYGGGTNLEAAFAMKSSVVSRLGGEPDTVVVMSDMEVNSTGYSYLKTPRSNLFTKDCLKIAVNFNSSKTTPLDPRDGWDQLVGWSPSLFQWADFKRQGDTLLQQFIDNTIEVL